MELELEMSIDKFDALVRDVNQKMEFQVLQVRAPWMLVFVSPLFIAVVPVGYSALTNVRPGMGSAKNIKKK